MSDRIELIIATPEREVYREQVSSVTIPTVQGEITVLAHHLPVTTILKHGDVLIRKDGSEEPYAVSGGFIEVQPHRLLIMADTAEHVAEIDEARAREAVARAEQVKAEQMTSTVDYTQVLAKLERDLNRLRVLRKYGSHRSRMPGITHQGIRPE